MRTATSLYRVYVNPRSRVVLLFPYQDPDKLPLPKSADLVIETFVIKSVPPSLAAEKRVTSSLTMLWKPYNNIADLDANSFNEDLWKRHGFEFIGPTRLSRARDDIKAGFNAAARIRLAEQDTLRLDGIPLTEHLVTRRLWEALHPGPLPLAPLPDLGPLLLGANRKPSSYDFWEALS